jgi:hypothetical protein
MLFPDHPFVGNRARHPTPPSKPHFQPLYGMKNTGYAGFRIHESLLILNSELLEAPDLAYRKPKVIDPSFQKS